MSGVSLFSMMSKNKNNDLKENVHGRHYHELNHPQIDKKASNRWLLNREVFPESEGFMLAIQEQVIKTNNYKKNVMKDKNTTTAKRKKYHQKIRSVLEDDCFELYYDRRIIADSKVTNNRPDIVVLNKTNKSISH